MSKAKSRVRNLLDGEALEGEKESASISESELRSAVKEGVAEALTEHEAETQAESEAESETESEEKSSRRGPSLKKVLLYGIIASILFYVRRSRQSSQTE